MPMRTIAAAALGLAMLAGASLPALSQANALDPQTPDGTDPSAQGIVVDNEPDTFDTPGGLAARAAEMVPILERVTGMPMLILERTGDDPGEFWYQAMTALCAKTGDNWCDDDVQMLTDTTNMLGWSRVLSYQARDSQGNRGGPTKKVCVILRPKPGVSAGFAAIGLAGGGAFMTEQLTTDAEAEAFLYLMHAGSCLVTGTDPALEQKRADTFAALALTLLEGSPAFLSGQAVTPARKFSNYRSGEAIRWAVSVGERVLLDLWKKQAAQVLQSGGCSASVVDSTQIDTQAIPRDGSLGTSGGNCLGQYRQGQVTDGNLYLWSNLIGGMPPQPYSPFMGFASQDAGMKYAWDTAGSISTQR